MKPAIIRTIDAQGRISIPIELRKTMGVTLGDSLEIHPVDDGVLLKKYQAAAIGKAAWKKYLSILYGVTRCGCALCSENEILMSRGIFLQEGTSITEEIADYIRKKETIVFSNTVYPTASSVYPADTLISFTTEGEFCRPAGLLLFHNNKSSIDNQDRACARLIAALLSSPN